MVKTGVFFALALGMTLGANAELRDVIVNGTFSDAPFDDRHADILKDFTRFPIVEKDWPQDSLRICYPGPGTIQVSDTACGSTTMPAIAMLLRRPEPAHDNGRNAVQVNLVIPTPRNMAHFKEQSRIVLLFSVGVPEGPSEVRFGVEVNDRLAFVETPAKPGWQARALDLTPWAGKPILFTLWATSGGASKAAFGRPLLIDWWGPYQMFPGGLANERRGCMEMSVNGPVLALVRVDCHTDARVEIGIGKECPPLTEKPDAEHTFRLSPGTHWIPICFKKPAAYWHWVRSGDAYVRQVDFVPGDTIGETTP